MKRLWIFYLYILLIWGVFRYFVRLPDVIVELWFKPLLWLTPIFWWQISLRNRVKMFSNNNGLSVVIGILVGLVYFVLVRRLNLSGFTVDINMVGVVVATAITEELFFSGFVAGYLEVIQKGKWVNLLLVGLMVAVIRLPILFFVYRLGFVDTFGVILFAGAGGVINAWIRVETGSVAGSILARIGMNLAVLG